MDNLNKELKKLKEKSIGIYKVRDKDKYSLIVGLCEDNRIDVVHISNFGAIQESFNMPLYGGQMELFPKGKNMNNILSTPYEWHVFIKRFKK